MMLGRRRKLAPERHYYPLDGLAERIRVVDARAAASGDYCLIIKVQGPNASQNFGSIAHLSDPAGAAAPTYGNFTDGLSSLSTSSRHRAAGLQLLGASNYGVQQSSGSGAAQRHVQMIGRDLVRNLVRTRVIDRAGTVVWSPSDQATVQDSDPRTLSIGAIVGPDGSSPTLFAAYHFVAAVLLPAPNTTDVLLTQYASDTCHDAREVWGASAITWYGTATGLLGQGTGPLLPTVGTTLGVCSGMNASKLVSL
jgi:hypothetical protein